VKRLFVAVAACCALTTGVTTSEAGAASVNANNTLVISADCGGQMVSVVTIANGNGTFTPAHSLDNTSVFIPTAFNLTFTFTTTDGQTFTDTNMASKAAPIGNTITCTIPSQSFEQPGGTATIEGTVSGFFTPRG
jgi:hypothetical protein